MRATLCQKVAVRRGVFAVTAAGRNHCVFLEQRAVVFHRFRISFDGFVSQRPSLPVGLLPMDTL